MSSTKQSYYPVPMKEIDGGSFATSIAIGSPYEAVAQPDLEIVAPTTFAEVRGATALRRLWIALV